MLFFAHIFAYKVVFLGCKTLAQRDTCVKWIFALYRSRVVFYFPPIIVDLRGGFISKLKKIRALI